MAKNRKSRAKIAILDNFVPRADTPSRFITLCSIQEQRAKPWKSFRQMIRENRLTYQFIEEFQANGGNGMFGYGYALLDESEINDLDME